MTQFSLIALAEGGWWTHDLDPVLFQITDRIAVRWYGLSYAVGAVVAWWIMRRFAKAKRFPMPPREVEDFVLFGAFLPMFLGGRIGYCILYGWDNLVRDPLYVFKVWEGGMASHGGLVGLAVGVAFWAWRKKKHALVLYDAVAATAPFGAFLGRVANFINGELWGRPTDVPWAVYFPEATRYADRGVPTPRHPSQLYAAGLEGLLIFCVCLTLYWRTQKPGLVAGTGFVIYAVVRFFGEFFRQPDTGLRALLRLDEQGSALLDPLLLAAST